MRTNLQVFSTPFSLCYIFHSLREQFYSVLASSNLNFIPSEKIDAFINQRAHQLNSLLIDWFGGFSEFSRACQPNSILRLLG
jgi:hypothetical protein